MSIFHDEGNVSISMLFFLEDFKKQFYGLSIMSASEVCDCNFMLHFMSIFHDEGNASSWLYHVS